MFGPLRSLALELTQAAHGVSATVTRPAPDDTPIATTGIWLTQPLDEARPFGTDIQRLQTRRVMVLPRSAVPTVPRGTTIVAPESQGGVTKTWTLEGVDRVEADHWRVIVTRAA